MHVEIEAKLKVDSLDRIADKLRELSGTFLREQTETDSYFDDADGSIRKADSALRLRQEESAGHNRTVLAFKGKAGGNSFKSRQEAELEVADGDAAEQLLNLLGFRARLKYQKRRALWRFADCTVCLDHLPLLGDFVEIEGPGDESISRVQSRLGLSDLRHIRYSYACLMDKKMRELGCEDRQAML